MKKSKKNIEVEIKVRVGNIKKLLSFLKKYGKFIAQSHQIDKYFIPAHRDFTRARPINEWLRLRDSSGKFSINYKNWHRGREGLADFCDEFETPLNDLNQVEKIFHAIDIKPIVVVDKIRKIWLYKDYEIAIDSVKNLGDFVEIEYKGKGAGQKPRQVTKDMIDFLKHLGCEKIYRDYFGYPFALLFPKEIKVKEY